MSLNMSLNTVDRPKGIIFTCVSSQMTASTLTFNGFEHLKAHIYPMTTYQCQNI